ncbi:phosphotransferase enzyme family protein [Gorillibacterium massiliense]|uniref:phosphotransferase enzyme family protein n=1 Tax=Gorillibacterium massiliense TaxID=1280390 RepID=UPI0004BCB420|nr:phosphotransferase [Gorillibacterium massiliense]
MKKVPDAVLKKLSLPYQADPSALCYFSGGHPWSDGVLYEYEKDAVPHILKVMEMPAGEAQDKLTALDARLQFVRFLGDRGIAIVHPERSVEGKLFTEEKEADRLYVCYSYRKREGVHIFETPRSGHEALFARWGEAMGSMHAAAKEYPVWRRLPNDPEGKILGWEQEWNGFHVWCKDEAVKESWRKLKNRLDSLPVERNSFGFTHNDLHIENLLAHDGNVTVLDFDVSNPHWFACDLATAVNSIFTYASEGKFEHPPIDPEQVKRLVRSFIRGYESANRLEPFWMEQVNTFLQYRRILLFIVFSEELSRNNPEHYKAWRKRILEDAPFPEYL